MPSNIKGYKVFIASPGGLVKERNKFKQIIEEYNQSEALHRDVIFQPVGWEDTLGSVGRPQGLINQDLIKCDYFVMVLHDRWGSNPGVNQHNATSGTQEEFKLALESLKNSEFPMRKLVVMFKAIPVNQLADPGKELKKVLEFKKKLEAEKTLLFHTFSTINEFTNHIKKHLSDWLRNHDLPNSDSPNSGSPNPDSPNPHLSGNEKELIPTGSFDKEIKAVFGTETYENSIVKDKSGVDRKAKESLINAWNLANKGQLVQAEIEFSLAIANQPGALQLLSFAMFLNRIGRLDQALAMVEKALEVSRESKDLTTETEALSERGNLLRTRGELAEAEEMYKQSNEINERLGKQEGLAHNYERLGILLRMRGDLENAEQMHRRAIEINQGLNQQEGLANNYGSLGNLLQMKGDLDGAEEMHKRALEINQRIGKGEGIASNYGNLGIILQMKGDLVVAEQMHRRALEINERLSRQEGLASNYGSLGILLQMKGDLEGAEDLHKRALAICERLGKQEGLASNYINLGILLQKKGNWEEAKRMYNQALEITRTFGFQELKRKVESLIENYNKPFK